MPMMKILLIQKVLNYIELSQLDSITDIRLLAEVRQEALMQTPLYLPLKGGRAKVSRIGCKLSRIHFYFYFARGPLNAFK